MLGEVAMYQEKWQEGESRLRHALTLQRELGDRYSLMITHVNLAHAILEQHRPDEALPILKDGLAYARSIKSRSGEAVALGNLAVLLFAIDDSQPAFVAAIEAFELAQEHALYQTLATLLELVGEQMLTHGYIDEGIQLLGAIQAAERAGSVELDERYKQTIDRLLDSLRDTHDAEQVDRIYQVSQSTALPEAIEMALGFCRGRLSEVQM
jgi:uncharacterized protein HemY